MQLNDNVLTAGGATLVAAASTMTSENIARPSAPASLTGISADITLFLKGMQVARAALADAARTGSETVASVMRESSELDAFITRSLGESFAVKGQPA